MPRRLASLLSVTLAALLFTGCGSQSYASDARSALNKMTVAISRYNHLHPSGVASTGAACHDAAAALADASNLASEKPPAAYARLGDALAHAYRSALAGFQDCERGAAVGDYQVMARADAELAAANAWIAQARALDH
ncbi:MAG TPA: hypothetical protein VKX16_01245 [Chloroflexota bacterium]|nr:hypothetical protein [Chloroflexota bacterium]